MAKATKAQAEERLNTVFTMLIAGSTRYQILQYCAKADWKLNTRQIDNYIARANDQIAAEAEYHRSRELGKAVYRMNMIFQQSLKVQDYQRAIAAQRELNLMLGLHAPKILELRSHEADLLNKILDSLKEQDIPASEVFSALLAEIEAAKRERK